MEKYAHFPVGNLVFQGKNRFQVRIYVEIKRINRVGIAKNYFFLKNHHHLCLLINSEAKVNYKKIGL